MATDAFRASVSRSNYRTSSPGFFDVRQVAASLRADRLQASSSDDTETIAALREAVSAAKEEAEAATELGLQAEADRKSIEDEIETLRSRNFGLQARIQALESQLRSSIKGTGISEPTSYDEFANWVQASFAGRLRLEKRAERALKQAEYANVSEVSLAVRILAEDYVNMRRGESTAEAFQSACANSGFEFSKSITKSLAGEQGEEYFVRDKGQRRFLEWHLKKGTSREPRFALRVYFFYDEDDEEVVIGWLPSHLTNRLS